MNTTDQTTAAKVRELFELLKARHEAHEDMGASHMGLHWDYYRSEWVNDEETVCPIDPHHKRS